MSGSHPSTANALLAVCFALPIGLTCDFVRGEAESLNTARQEPTGQSDSTREKPGQESNQQQQKSKSGEVSVRPGINDRFVSPDFKIGEWVDRFEGESREVFAARHDIVKACGIREGMAIADIGSGTGLYTRLFAETTGSEGWVYAVDIAPRFLEHVNKVADELRLSNVTSVLCAADSTRLPPACVDLVFICDTYHHFEFPQSTLASIHQALRKGGSLVVIDFERIPGKTREWLLDHVRADKQTFRGEIERAGFEFVEEVKIKQFRENYFLRFRRK